MDSLPGLFPKSSLSESLPYEGLAIEPLKRYKRNNRDAEIDIFTVRLWGLEVSFLGGPSLEEDTFHDLLQGRIETHTREEVAKLLITWLTIGLLGFIHSSMLDRESSEEGSHYDTLPIGYGFLVETDRDNGASPQYNFSMSRFSGIARLWYGDIVSKEVNMAHATIHQIDKALGIANAVVRSLFIDQAPYGDQCAVSLASKHLIITFLDTVDDFLHRVYHSHFTNQAWPGSTSVHDWGHSEIVIASLRTSGYCPHEIEMLSSLFRTRPLAYVAAIVHPCIPRDHSTCVPERCTASHVSSTFTGLHTSECDKRCHQVTTKLEEIEKILEQGSWPVIQFENSAIKARSSHPFKVIAASTSENFVAISHVWADGLGNSLSNGIFHCQAARIAKYIEAVCDGNSCPIWLDTLCVPVQGKYRELAIKRMYETYASASKILVLDAELQAHDFVHEFDDDRRLLALHQRHPRLHGLLQRIGGSRIHSSQTISESKKLRMSLIGLLRVAASGWMRRLWTLQEAYLAKNFELHIQFRDQSVELDQLLQITRLTIDVWPAKHSKNWIEPFLGEIVQPYLFIRPHFLGETRSSGVLRQGEHIARITAQLMTSMNWRSTSRPSDEALVLASLAQVDMEKVFRMKEADAGLRMLEVFSKLKYFPAELLFHKGLRLNDPIFRWAPTSLLFGQSKTIVSSLSKAAPAIEKLGDKFVAQLPGFIIAPSLIIRARIVMEEEEPNPRPWTFYHQFPGTEKTEVEVLTDDPQCQTLKFLRRMARLPVILYRPYIWCYPTCNPGEILDGVLGYVEGRLRDIAYEYVREPLNEDGTRISSVHQHWTDTRREFHLVGQVKLRPKYHVSENVDLSAQLQIGKGYQVDHRQQWLISTRSL